MMWWYSCSDLVSRVMSSRRNFRARISFFDSITETPSTLYSIVESRGFSRPMTAAKFPKAFWSTSEEAIHKAHVPEIGESGAESVIVGEACGMVQAEQRRSEISIG